MNEIEAYCKNKKVIRVYLGGKDTCSEEEKIAFEKEKSFKCEDLEILLKKSWMGNDVDFSQYIDWDILNITNFEKKVYIATMNIPKGQIRSYKEIGDMIGSRGYRAVGNALNKNPIAIIVPCHRVVGSNKKLIGFTAGLDLKKEVLNNEGIKIEKDTIILP